MRKCFLLILVILISLPTLATKYVIYMGDALLGFEEVVFVNNQVITNTEINASGQKLLFSQTLAFKGNQPELYQANLNNQVSITGTLKGNSATFTVAKQSRTFRGKGLYPVENNTFFLWSYIFQDAPSQIVVPSQLLMLKANYSAWAPGPYNTKVRQVNVGQLAVFGYFFEDKLVRLSIPTQGLECYLQDWETVFKKQQDINYRSIPVVISRENDLLHGELDLPKNTGQFPVLLLLSGSGPQDRDNNSPPEMNNSLFKHLTRYLIANGYGVLRFDDRGTGKSTGNHMNKDLQTLIEDSVKAIDYLKTRTDVKKIGILGHSEGGVIATKLAANRDDIAFLILLATPSQSLDQILLEQLNSQLGIPNLSAQNRKYLEGLLDLTKTSLGLAKKGQAITPLGFTGPYLKQHMETDTGKLASLVTQPVLILQGEADLKVLPHHAEDLRRAFQKSTGIKVITYPHLTHYFTPSPLNNPKFGIEEVFQSPEKIYLDIVDWLLSSKL